MALRIEQVLFRPAMGIMAGNARCRPRLEPLVGRVKGRGALVVTLGTELVDRCRCQVGMIGTVSAMAGGATLARGGMHGAVPPIFGYFFVAAETKGRLALVQVAGLR